MLFSFAFVLMTPTLIVNSEHGTELKDEEQHQVEQQQEERPLTKEAADEVTVVLSTRLTRSLRFGKSSVNPVNYVYSLTIQAKL